MWRSLNSFIIATPMLGIERGVLSAGSASDSINIEQSVMCVVLPDTLPAANLVANGQFAATV